MPATGETMEEGSPEEEAAEPKQEAMQEGDEPTSAKLSPEFQKEVDSLVDGLETLPELEYIAACVKRQMKSVQSAQKKTGLATDKFSTEGMPE